MSEYSLFVFLSTHSAIAAQNALCALSPALIPTLREITEGCGMSLKIELCDTDMACGILTDSGLFSQGEITLYRVCEKGSNTFCKKIKEI